MECVRICVPMSEWILGTIRWMDDADQVTVITVLSENAPSAAGNNISLLPEAPNSPELNG